ncbi:MAG: pentapeptide repeat-containing protein [Coriobacteriales bacterium]|nr:pentapeptide repeat-containing protein [Coriobacteriales bacterium]
MDSQAIGRCAVIRPAGSLPSAGCVDECWLLWLRGARLRGVRLRGVRLRGARLRGARPVFQRVRWLLWHVRAAREIFWLPEMAPVKLPLTRKRKQRIRKIRIRQIQHTRNGDAIRLFVGERNEKERCGADGQQTTERQNESPRKSPSLRRLRGLRGLQRLRRPQSVPLSPDADDGSKPPARMEVDQQ